jgi:hypothetical protein
MTDDIERLVRDALAEDRRVAFGPGFADRAVSRWRASQNQPSIGTLLAGQFARLTPLAAAAVIALTFYNVRSNESTSTIDRLFGLTPVTVESAYDIGLGPANGN